MKRNGLKEKVARRFFRQIVSAVSYLHDNNLVHRDIKPHNIILDDSHTIAKLIDFGFTTMFNEDDALASFIGSPSYAAPEILKGIRYRGPKIDVWSLGCCLFQMVAGRQPFTAANMEQLLDLASRACYECPASFSPGACRTASAARMPSRPRGGRQHGTGGAQRRVARFDGTHADG